MCIYLREAFISLKHGFSAVFIHEQRSFEEVRNISLLSTSAYDRWLY